MIKKFLFTVICFKVAVFSFGQTELQKQIIYEQINRDSRTRGIVERIDPIENKVALFSKAQVLPVYKIEIKENEKPKLIQNKNYYLILYTGRLYIFIDNNTTRLIENSPIIQNLLDLNKQRKEYFVVYLIETFSFNRKYLMPLLTNREVNWIIDKGISYKFQDYIEFKFGSKEKYLENYILDQKREALSISDFNTICTYNYQAYQVNCPKDTTLVLRTMVGQIKSATKKLTKMQEIKLFEGLKRKINPYGLFEEELRKALISGKVKESDIQVAQEKRKIVNSKTAEVIDKPEELYLFSVYDVNVTDLLLSILTNQQFIDYKNYIDLLYPIIETQNRYINNKYRYNYGKDILQKKGIIKEHDPSAFTNYVRKKLQDCGCKDSEM
ncbi:hypothetical protein ACHRVW_09025 [Flavobacterium collinsii]|uniref:hypothetical protein n=1 Tax=Flavobacterium collinsii TaxID=1114861 RepID=UPI0037567A79